MRSQVLLLAFALLVAVARSSSRQHHRHHHSHVHAKAAGHGEDGGGGGGGELARRPAVRSWPCCDNCGGCTKSRCQCLDAAPRGCHPACRDCVKSSLSVDPPVYQCMDRVPNFCHRRCTAPAAVAVR